MKNSVKLIILGIVSLLVVGFLFNGCSKYNALVEQDEKMNTEKANVKTAWSKVENQYQRRADLIPNLVETVKGYTKYEKEIITNIEAARSGILSIKKADPEDPNSVREYVEKQNRYNIGTWLMPIVAQYPELKANQQFMNLQTQLEGTENRITVARNDYINQVNRYNEAVQKYNTYIRKFPNNIYAAIFGFHRKEVMENPFKAKEGSDVAPTIKF
ncbi:MAG: LemA family protein [Bacteroidia bacterium]|nr:LemA family protein [Bacteroidia bacterium]MDW8302882.1 LemA family protein [Bacteroidia bacterium]